MNFHHHIESNQINDFPVLAIPRRSSAATTAEILLATEARIVRFSPRRCRNR